MGYCYFKDGDHVFLTGEYEHDEQVFEDALRDRLGEDFESLYHDLKDEHQYNLIDNFAREIADSKNDLMAELMGLVENAISFMSHNNVDGAAETLGDIMNVLKDNFGTTADDIVSASY